MVQSSSPQKYKNGFRIRWTDEHGIRRSACCKTHKEAATVLLKKKFEVRQINLGITERIHSDKTFNDLCDYWIQNIAPAKKSRKDIVSIINGQLRPFFGRLKLTHLTQEHGQDYSLKKLNSNVSKKTVSNHLTVFISMLNFAHEMKWLREVPKIRKPKVPKTSVFTYLKSDEEIKSFLMAAKKEGVLAYSLYATSIFTGLRLGELAGLTWDDVNLNTRTIRVQRSFDKCTKSEEIRFVPIVDSLLPILDELKHTMFSKYVFPSRVGSMMCGSASIFKEIFKRVLRNAGFSEINIDNKTKSYIRFHDLRHTFASHWMMKGGDLYRLQKIMGHQSVEMTQRYSHLAPHIYQQDYSRFNSLL